MKAKYAKYKKVGTPIPNQTVSPTLNFVVTFDYNNFKSQEKKLSKYKSPYPSLKLKCI